MIVPFRPVSLHMHDSQDDMNTHGTGWFSFWKYISVADFCICELSSLLKENILIIFALFQVFDLNGISKDYAQGQNVVNVDRPADVSLFELFVFAAF